MIRRLRLVLLAGGLFAGSGAAAPEKFRKLDEAVSADTLVFVSIPDGARAKAQLETTALADIWREPEVRQFANTVAPQLVQAFMGMVESNLNRAHQMSREAEEMMLRQQEEMLEGTEDEDSLRDLREKIRKAGERKPDPDKSPLDLWKELQAKTGLSLRDLALLFEGEVSFALERLETGDAGDPFPVLALVAGPSGFAKRFEAVLEACRADLPKDFPVPVKTADGTVWKQMEKGAEIAKVPGYRWHKAEKVWKQQMEKGAEIAFGRVGDRFLLTLGHAGRWEELLGRLRKGGQGGPRSLSAHPDYLAVRKKLSEKSEPFALVYANAVGIASAAAVPLAKEGNLNKAKAVVDALGFSDVRAGGSSVAVLNKGFFRRSVLLAPGHPGQRKGLLAAFAGDSKGIFKSQAFVPAGVHGYVASRIDPNAVWGLVRSCVSAAGGAAAMDEFEQNLDQGIASDLRKEICEALGTEVAVTMKQATGLIPIPEVNLYVELKDEAKARSVLKRLMDLGAEAGAFRAAQSKPTTGPAITTLQFSAPLPVMPSYAVHKGFLVVSLSPPALKGALAQMDGAKGGIAATADYRLAMSKLRPATSLVGYEEGPDSFRKQYSQIVQMLPMILMALHQQGGEFPEIDFASLPTADAVAQHLFGGGTVMGTDADGIYYESFGVGMVSATDAIFGVGLAAGLLLPAVSNDMSNAKEQAQTMKCQANLREIGIAIALNGRRPKDLEELLKDKRTGLHETQCACPIHGTGYTLLPYDAKAAEKDPSSTQVAICPGRHGGARGGAVVLFADGHVELVPRREIEEIREKNR